MHILDTRWYHPVGQADRYLLSASHSWGSHLCYPLDDITTCTWCTSHSLYVFNNGPHDGLWQVILTESKLMIRGTFTTNIHYTTNIQITTYVEIQHKQYPNRNKYIKAFQEISNHGTCMWHILNIYPNTTTIHNATIIQNKKYPNTIEQMFKTQQISVRNSQQICKTH